MNKSIDMQVHNENELQSKIYSKSYCDFYTLFDLLKWKFWKWLNVKVYE